MSSCPFAIQLQTAHVGQLGRFRANDTWDVAMAKKAATDAAWQAVCEHRAICPLCKGQPELSERVH